MRGGCHFCILWPAGVWTFHGACLIFTERDNTGMPATSVSTGTIAPVSPVPLLAVCLTPSIRLAIVLSIAHFMAICLLWPLTLPAAAKLAGSVIMAASLVLYLRHYALLRSPGSAVGFELTQDMTCILETKNGNIACMILGSSFVAPYLAVLELQPLEPFAGSSSAGIREWWRKRWKHRPRSVVILPDAIEAEAFRQLRVLLRWKWKEPS